MRKDTTTTNSRRRTYTGRKMKPLGEEDAQQSPRTPSFSELTASFLHLFVLVFSEHQFPSHTEIAFSATIEHRSRRKSFSGLQQNNGSRTQNARQPWFVGKAGKRCGNGCRLKSGNPVHQLHGFRNACTQRANRRPPHAVLFRMLGLSRNFRRNTTQRCFALHHPKRRGVLGSGKARSDCDFRRIVRRNRCYFD